MIVWKYDRIGRSTVELVNLLEEFRERDVQFISHTNNVDTGTKEGRKTNQPPSPS